MMRMAITGGIGSGKTTISKIFEHLGVPVFYADIEAKSILFSESIKADMAVHFGVEIFDEKGKVDTKRLASVVFSDKEKLSQLNSLIHPLLMQHFEHWCHAKATEKYPYVVMEAAILFEGGFNKNVDFVVGVVAPEQERIQRVMKRDQISRERVLDRIQNQFAQQKIAELSDFVISNANGEMVLEKVIDIHQQFSSA
jgi:dephospho-CoA kinase